MTPWTLIEPGRTLALVGVALPAPPSRGTRVLRVPCDRPEEAHGAVMALRRRVEQILGGAAPSLDLAAERLRRKLRARLLGEEPERDRAWVIEEPLQQVTDLLGPLVVVFEYVERADASSVAALRDFIEQGTRTPAALVLTFAEVPPDGPAVGLLEAVREVEGESHVLVGRAALEARPLAPAEQDRTALRPAVDLAELDREVRRTLQAASIAGPVFEGELLAELLDVDPLRVLEHLQTAREAGFVVLNGGGHFFRMDQAQAAAVRATVMPALGRAWRLRLGELLSGAPLPAQADPGHTQPAETVTAETASLPDTEEMDAIDVGALADADERAARFFEEAGEVEAAVDRLLAAAEQAAALGDPLAALDRARRAVELAHALPPHPLADAVEARARLAVGRLQWEAGAAGGDFTLAGARDEVAEAIDQMDALPVEEQADARRVLAAICYDLGDRASLEQGYEALTEGTRRLSEAGRVTAAAALLNDQAALLVRLGDPVQAAYLLRQSREVFARAPETDPLARAELAETDHLLARLPLHVEARPGNEEEAPGRALEHAKLAADAYRKLGDTRSAARVGETMGRLLVLLHRLDEAAEVLRATFRTQEALGDVVGLARTSGALVDLLLDAGRYEDALALLGESARLNQAKGSAFGVAVNRAALTRISAGMPEGMRPKLDAQMQAVAVELAGSP